jgi:hypothetical protein
MKTEKEIKGMLEKLTYRIEREEAYLMKASGEEITLKNRIALQEQINEWKHRKSMLEWLYSEEPTKAMRAGFERN